MTEQALKTQFRTLALALEPENLNADGERSRKQAQQARIQINREWGKLERQIGRTVTPSEVWSWA
jgi:hypothetical protein